MIVLPHDTVMLPSAEAPIDYAASRIDICGNYEPLPDSPRLALLLPVSMCVLCGYWVDETIAHYRSYRTQWLYHLAVVQDSEFCIEILLRCRDGMKRKQILSLPGTSRVKFAAIHHNQRRIIFRHRQVPSRTWNFSNSPQKLQQALQNTNRMLMWYWTKHFLTESVTNMPKPCPQHLNLSRQYATDLITQVWDTYHGQTDFVQTEAPLLQTFLSKFLKNLTDRSSLTDEHRKWLSSLAWFPPRGT